MPMPKGLWHNPETRAKISIALRGRKLSPETCARRMGNKNSLGHKHTAETRAKMCAARVGKQPGWKGGRSRQSDGYMRIYCPDHPHHDGQGYVMEHRLVMEAHLGRTLLPSEVVHHINGIKDDNRIENLMLFSSDVEHHRYHKTWRRA